MFLRVFKSSVNNQFVRNCHHSKKLEEYQIIGLQRKMKDIEILLCNVSNELNSINSLIGIKPIENIKIKNELCNTCLINKFINKNILEKQEIIRKAPYTINNICTICGNIRT